MIDYMKKGIQVIVLTVVLVFGALLVINSDVTIRDVQAQSHHTSTAHWPEINPEDNDIVYYWHETYSGG